MKRIFSYATIIAILFFVASCSTKSNEVWFKLGDSEEKYDWENDEWITTSWDWYADHYGWEKKGEWFVCDYPKDSTTFSAWACFKNDIDVMRGLTHIKVPSSVKHISEECFSGGHILTDVEIPLTVKSIGDRALYYCEELNKIDLPEGVELGNDVFYTGSAVDINYYSKEDIKGKRTLKSFFTGRRTYDIAFDHLSCEYFSKAFALPENFSFCRVEVTTSDKEFNALNYLSDCREFPFDSGKKALHAPLCDATVKVFNEYGEKRIEFTTENDSRTINQIKVWEDGNLRCEAKGEISFFDFCYIFMGGKYKLYDRHNGKWYLKKEEKTKGYSTYCEQYKTYITEYYPSGKKYHIYEADAYFSDNDSYDFNTITDVFLAEDGTEMTLVDRLFQNVEDFIILETDKRGVRYRYIAILPDAASPKRGYLIGFTSPGGDMGRSISRRVYCRYVVYENSLECTNFREWNGFRGWIDSYQSKIFIDIVKDGFNQLELKSMNHTRQWFDNANFRIVNTDHISKNSRSWMLKLFMEVPSEPLLY